MNPTAIDNAEKSITGCLLSTGCTASSTSRLKPAAVLWCGWTGMITQNNAFIEPMSAILDQWRPQQPHVVRRLYLPAQIGL